MIKKNNANEWFVTDLATVKKAIIAVKEDRKSLSSSDISTGRDPIIFRPEQRAAIEQTTKQFTFKREPQKLWNAKMRFGKTLCALQVVKEMDFTRTLILTHRPVVNEGWFEDFNKIFYDSPQFAYGSKDKGDSYLSLEKRATNKKAKYVYFASIQDLRGSKKVGGDFDKNNKLFATQWDFVIVDEAHEGTQTELGKNVLGALIKKHTKTLHLSGTPFNLLVHFKEEDIYTWDYVMEQRAKRDWDIIHRGDPNPYAPLPQMNIRTYSLGKLFNKFVDAEKAFNFKAFFRVNDKGDFIHKEDIKKFLNLLSKKDDHSNYPFSNDTYRDIFRHTLWMLPGVKDAKAFSILLQQHSVFQHFKIVNVAGDGDEDEENKNALELVQNAIGKDAEQTRTITLSCGRLTTGVSVPAWTAVIMLAGSYNTSASSYIQTIFRVQTPATINGRMKENCYVFDFAPDRTLKVLAETAKISAKAGKTSQADRVIMGEFLNFCPVIAQEGSKTEVLDVPKMLAQLKKIYVERVVKNGFEDRSLYNDKLMKLDGLALQEFADLRKTIGATKAQHTSDQIEINKQGLDDEQYEELERLEKKNRGPKEAMSEAEKQRMKELQESKKNRDAAISILRGISIRMPLLIYGAELEDENKEITIENFSSLIDDKSWEEFMPRGVSKTLFHVFTKYYDPDIFSAAGKRIREMVRAADNSTIEERIERISHIFSTFRNPDKETVLTPWRVVNMHLGDCLGGFNFYDKDYQTPINKPRFIDKKEVNATVFEPNARILEINSKSGLYPLYMTYSIYRARIKESLIKPENLKQHLVLWDKTLNENIFVLCKTKMAEAITKRTLAGFRNARVHIHVDENIIKHIKEKPTQLSNEIVTAKFWNLKKQHVMKFSAIIGNPPYQVMDGGGDGTSAITIYNHFVELAKIINANYISMIMPARWYVGGKGLDNFRTNMLKDTHIVSMFDFFESREIFPSADIAGGVCYFLRDKNYSGTCSITSVYNNTRQTNERILSEYETFIRQAEAVSIIDKIKLIDKHFFSASVYSRKPFGLDNNYQGLKKTFANAITLYGSQGISYIKLDEVKQNQKVVNRWKVIASKASAQGGRADKAGMRKVIPKVEVLPPQFVCTESYLLLIDFDNKENAHNASQYIKSKFFRFLLSLSAITQNISKESFHFVPLQDFTSHSDIDWNKSIGEIDAQLYSKYNLTKTEIDFIEKMIKPM